MSYQFEYEIEKGIITIFPVDNSINEFDIEVEEFWKFVQANDLNAYCTDFYDSNENDRHGQEVGYFEMDEYLDYDYKSVKIDLDFFISKTKYKNQFHV